MSTDPVPSSPDRPRERWWVYGSIVFAFVIFFFFVAVLYWYWIKTPEPTSIIRIPTGNAKLDGTLIRISDGPLQKPIEVKLSAQNDYGTRIYLVPGDYEIQVFDRSGRLQFKTPLAMAPLYERTLNLVAPQTDLPSDTNTSE